MTPKKAFERFAKVKERYLAEVNMAAARLEQDRQISARALAGDDAAAVLSILNRQIVSAQVAADMYDCLIDDLREIRDQLLDSEAGRKPMPDDTPTIVDEAVKRFVNCMFGASTGFAGEDERA